MEIAFGVIGGLGMFLYGMNIMGTGLQKAAGKKLKRLIEVLTRNRLMGVLIGALVTMVIQTSSGTTVMVVGFVNAGIMTLKQAVGVIMGANVGTTVTAQLIAFDLSVIAPVAIAIGVALLLFSSNTKTKDLAEILIGFGILFVGMDFMSNALAPLSDSPTFVDLVKSLDNPVIGLLVGFGLTTILQSSSASIGLLLALAGQGFLDIDMALPILFGDNIGTTTTAMLSSIGASKTAKQAAFIHFLFNTVGTLLFVFVLATPIKLIVMSVSGDSVERQIANAHTIFNFANVIIQFPFAGFLVKAAEKVIKDDKRHTKRILKHIDDRIIETPSVAVAQVSKEVLRMGRIAENNLKLAAEAFYSKDDKLIAKVFSEEKRVNELEQYISEYLVQLSSAPMTDEQHGIITTLFHVINDIERISDHSENIAELTTHRIDDDLWFTDDAIGELHIMFDKVYNLYKDALLSFKTADLDLAKKVIVEEDEIDIMEKKYRLSHIERLNTRSCKLGSGIVYLDIISNLERVADHSSNIAKYVLDTVE